MIPKVPLPVSLTAYFTAGLLSSEYGGGSRSINLRVKRSSRAPRGSRVTGEILNLQTPRSPTARGFLPPKSPSHNPNPDAHPPPPPLSTYVQISFTGH